MEAPGICRQPGNGNRRDTQHYAPREPVVGDVWENRVPGGPRQGLPFSIRKATGCMIQGEAVSVGYRVNM